MSDYLDLLGTNQLYYIRPQLYRGETLYNKFIQLLKLAECTDGDDFGPYNNGVVALVEMIDNIDGYSPIEYFQMKEKQLITLLYEESECINLYYIKLYIMLLAQAEKENKLVLKKFNQE